MVHGFVLTIVGYRGMVADGEYLIACEMEGCFFSQCQILLLQCTAYHNHVVFMDIKSQNG